MLNFGYFFWVGMFLCIISVVSILSHANIVTNKLNAAKMAKNLHPLDIRCANMPSKEYIPLCKQWISLLGKIKSASE